MNEISVEIILKEDNLFTLFTKVMCEPEFAEKYSCPNPIRCWSDKVPIGGC